jgi:hypothetical protein
VLDTADLPEGIALKTKRRATLHCRNKKEQRKNNEIRSSPNLDIMEYTLQLRPQLLNFKKENYQSDLLFVSTGVGVILVTS